MMAGKIERIEEERLQRKRCPDVICKNVDDLHCTWKKTA